MEVVWIMIECWKLPVPGQFALTQCQSQWMLLPKKLFAGWLMFIYILRKLWTVELPLWTILSISCTNFNTLFVCLFNAFTSFAVRMPFSCRLQWCFSTLNFLWKHSGLLLLARQVQFILFQSPFCVKQLWFKLFQLLHFKARLFHDSLQIASWQVEFSERWAGISVQNDWLCFSILLNCLFHDGRVSYYV